MHTLLASYCTLLHNVKLLMKINCFNYNNGNIYKCNKSFKTNRFVAYSLLIISMFISVDSFLRNCKNASVIESLSALKSINTKCNFSKSFNAFYLFKRKKILKNIYLYFFGSTFYKTSKTISFYKFFIS